MGFALTQNKQTAEQVQADEFNNPTPQKEVSIEDLVQQGKLPQLPDVIARIKSGDLPLKDAMEGQARAKADILSGKINPPEDWKRAVLGSEYTSTNKTQDEILNELVTKNEIPDLPEVLAAIKSGELTLERVKEVHKINKIRWPHMTGNAQGDITTNPTSPNPTQQEESYSSGLMGQDVSSLSIPGSELVGKAIKTIKEDISWAEKNAQLPFKEAVVNQLKRDAASMAYVANKFLGGLSFDVYDPDMEAPSGGAAFAGALASLTGNVVSGVLGGAALKAIPVVGPAIAGLEKSAQASTGLAKHAKSIASILPEAATTGFVAGATKSVIKGNNFWDVMADGVVDAGIFAGSTLLLYPAAEGAGKVFARRKVGRTQAAKALAEREGRSIAESAAQQVGEGKTRADIVIERIKGIPEADRTVDQSKLLSSLERIKASQPVAGPFQAAELVKDPEVLYGLMKEDAGVTVKGLFQDENAPLRSIYDTNPSIKSMVDSGDYVGALGSVQGAFREQLKDFKTVGEMVAAPFINDASSVYGVVADRVLRRANPIKYPRLNRNLLIDYFDKGTKAAQQAVFEAVPTAQKKILGKEVFGNIQDIRMNPNDIDKLVGDVLETQLKVINDGGSVTFENMGKLKDMDAIFKAAVTFNKDLSRSSIQAYREGYGAIHDSFIRAPEDLQAGIRDEINIRRILVEKSDEVARVRELKNRISELVSEGKAAGEVPAAKAIRKKLDSLRLELKDSSTNLFNMRRALNEASSALNSLPPEKQIQVRSFVDQVYLPTKKQLGVKRTSDYLNRFDYKDNPIYLKNGSALADTMNAMLVAGKDFDIKGFKSYVLPFGVNIENLTQKMNKEFGPNNPIEQFFRQIKERNSAVRVASKKYQERLKSIGIKEGTKESALLHKFAEKRLLTTDLEFLDLSPKIQNKLIEGEKTIRGIYDELIDSHNEMARANNIPEINKREDYVTHYKDVQGALPNFIESWSSGNKEILNPFDNKPFNVTMASRNGDPSKPFFRWELQRSGGEFTEDAIGAISRYLEPSLERIFYTDLVREADAARAFAPNNFGKLFDRIKKDYLLKLPNEIEKETSAGLGGTLKAFTSRMAEGQLFYKVNTAVQQITSMALNFSAGGREAIAASTKMFTKEGERRWKMSMNGILRNAVEDVDIDARLFKGMLKDWNKSKVTQTVKTGYDYYKKFGRFALELFDKTAVKHAYLTGFEKAVAGGLEGKAAAAYADKWADAIHNSLAKIDKPDSKLLNSTLGRSLFQFQSYSINLAASLMNDLPNMAFHDGAAKAVTSILRAVAATSIVNEGFRDIGLPAPFALKEFIPLMSTYRFGVPGYFAALKETANYIGGSKSDQKKATKRAASLGAGLLIPGGGQIFNVISANNAKKKGKIMRKDLNKARAFGPSAIIRAKEQKKEAKRAFKKNPIIGVGEYGVGPTKRDMRRLVKRKIFQQ